MIFNLFIEALHWILEKHLSYLLIFIGLVHYLDDFIFIIRPRSNVLLIIYIYNATIILLSFPPATKKDSYSIVSIVLGYQVDINTLILSLPI